VFDRRSGLWLALMALGVCSTPSLLRAQAASVAERACGRAGRPWVALAFMGEDWSPEQRDAITADLRAGLRLRGIEVCALGTEGSEPPLAMVQLGAPSAQRVSVSIDVHDAITEKRVLRDVDLRHVTLDGRGLRVAQAAEELLRASWAELALADAPPPAAEPPPEVTQAVIPAQSAPDRSRMLGVRFAAEHHGAPATLLGADAAFSWFFAERIGAEVAFGLRRGLRADATHGSIDTSSYVGTLALAVALLPRREAFGLQAKLATAVSHVSFEGRGDSASTRAHERALLAAGARASLVADLWLSRALDLSIELGPGVPLRAATARDTGSSVVGTGGLELHAALGLAVAF
jgi:hypothetical protein